MYRKGPGGGLGCTEGDLWGSGVDWGGSRKGLGRTGGCWDGLGTLGPTGGDLRGLMRGLRHTGDTGRYWGGSKGSLEVDWGALRDTEMYWEALGGPEGDWDVLGSPEGLGGGHWDILGGPREGLGHRGRPWGGHIGKLRHWGN